MCFSYNGTQTCGWLLIKPSTNRTPLCPYGATSSSTYYSYSRLIVSGLLVVVQFVLLFLLPMLNEVAIHRQAYQGQIFLKQLALLVRQRRHTSFSLGSSLPSLQCVEWSNSRSHSKCKYAIIQYRWWHHWPIALCISHVYLLLLDFLRSPLPWILPFHKIDHFPQPRLEDRTDEYYHAQERSGLISSWLWALCQRL